MEKHKSIFTAGILTSDCCSSTNYTHTTMVTSREKEELPYDEKKEQHHANITVLAGHENEAEQAEELVLAESEFTYVNTTA